MPVFAILILSAIPYLVSCSSETSPAGDKNKNTTNEAVSNSANNSLNNSLDSSDKGSTKSADSQASGKAIELPHYPPDFPAGDGKDLFISRCGVCHSLRYVTMQPDFPKKTWAKEVDKMIKTYGAHIDKKEAEAITQYLYTIKGKAPGAEKH
jgi:mono/diheme cytochrome c family protein